jgi:hypothetical protein
MKWSAKAVYDGYRPGGSRVHQLEAMAGYATRRAYNIGLILTVRAPESRAQMKGLQLIIERNAIKKHFILFIFSLETKRFK